MDWRRALFFSGFPPARERRGGGSAVSPSPWPSPIEGEGMLETRKKPGAVFGPVFARERSWICASAVERRRPV